MKTRVLIAIMFLYSTASIAQEVDSKIKPELIETIVREAPVAAGNGAVIPEVDTRTPDGGRARRRFVLTPEAPVAGCPFSPSAPDFQVISNLRDAISTLETNEECRGGQQASNPLSSQVAALRAIEEVSSCNLLQSAERDYQFVTSNLTGEALGYIPSAYQQCKGRQNGPLDMECVEQIHTQQAGNFQRQCREAQRQDTDRLAARSLDEAAILITSSVSRLISNPACTGDDALSQLADTTISALPLIATSIPGFGLPIAVGAQAITSILQRMFASESAYDRINNRLQAVGIRCLHFQAMATLLNCGGDSTAASGALEVERGMVLGLSRLSEELKRQSTGDGPTPKLNTGLVLRTLNEPINLPDGRETTLRELMTEILQSPAPDSRSLEAVQRARMQQLLSLAADSSVDAPGIDDVSEGVLNYLQSRFPASISNIASAWTSVRAGPRLAPPSPRQSNDVNFALGHFTQEIRKRERNGQFSFEALASLESSARNGGPGGNDIEFRKNALRERFNTCAYNSYLLLADKDRLKDSLRNEGQGSILSALKPSAMTQFRSLCGEYSCVIDIPVSFGGADDYKSWQCKIFQNQQSVARALDSKITAWAANGGTGGVCGEPAAPAGAAAPEGDRREGDN